LQHLQHKT